jgi:hypothetical protein
MGKPMVWGTHILLGVLHIGKIVGYGETSESHSLPMFIQEDWRGATVLRRINSY